MCLDQIEEELFIVHITHGVIVGQLCLYLIFNVISNVPNEKRTHVYNVICYLHISFKSLYGFLMTMYEM